MVRLSSRKIINSTKTALNSETKEVNLDWHYTFGEDFFLLSKLQIQMWSISSRIKVTDKPVESFGFVHSQSLHASIYDCHMFSTSYICENYVLVRHPFRNEVHSSNEKLQRVILLRYSVYCRMFPVNLRFSKTDEL